MMLDDPEVPPLTPTPCANAAEATNIDAIAVIAPMRAKLDVMVVSISLMKSQRLPSCSVPCHTT